MAITATEMTPLKDAKRGDQVAFLYRDVPCVGRVVRVKKDGTLTVEVADDDGDFQVDVRVRK